MNILCSARLKKLFLPLWLTLSTERAAGIACKPIVAAHKDAQLPRGADATTNLRRRGRNLLSSARCRFCGIIVSGSVVGDRLCWLVATAGCHSLSVSGGVLFLYHLASRASIWVGAAFYIRSAPEYAPEPEVVLHACYHR